MRYLVVTCILLASLFGRAAASTAQTAHAATPQGAIVQSVNINGKVVSVTVLNQGGKDITGFSVALVAHFADGHVEPAEHTKNYTPLTRQVIAPNQTATIDEAFETPPITADAKVSVVIYKDGTSETSDPRSLSDIIDVRRRFAKAYQFAAEVVRQSLTDPHPTEYITSKLATLDGKSRDDTNDALGHTIKFGPLASADGREHEFMQSEADRLSKQAKLFSDYANVREDK